MESNAFDHIMLSLDDPMIESCFKKSENTVNNQAPIFTKYAIHGELQRKL